jgi:hypothetical protein
MAGICVTYVARTCQSRASLQLEVAALRHQLEVYKEEGAISRSAADNTGVAK